MLVGRSFTALDPDPGDAQLFAYIGLKWAQGYVRYVDIWDHKLPGIFAVNAVAFFLFPKSFTALAYLAGVFIAWRGLSAMESPARKHAG